MVYICPMSPVATILRGTGIGNAKDYHPDVWEQLLAGVGAGDEMTEEELCDGKISIDDEPFRSLRIPVDRDPHTLFARNSFPHPGLTHLILTDNSVLLERRLASSCPSGLM
jgi:hypothetical protein